MKSTASSQTHRYLCCFPLGRQRDAVFSVGALLLALFFTRSATISLWNLWLSPLNELTESLHDLQAECQSVLQPGHFPVAAGKEGKGHNVMYGDFRGPHNLCGNSPESVSKLLAIPHNCSRTAERVWLREKWMTVYDMVTIVKEPNEGGESSVECAIFCVDHEGPCQYDRCLVPIFMRRNSTDPLVAKQLLERGEYDVVRPDMAFRTILDAGANCGIASIIFATMFPHATIVSVEPSSDNFRSLQRNTQNFPNVIPVRAGLWPRVATLALTAGPRTPGLEEWGFMVQEKEKVVRGVKVLDTLRGVSIEFLLRTFNLAGFDLLKIDIEGSEKELLASSLKVPLRWLDSAKMAMFEVHEDMRRGSKEAVSSAFRQRPEWYWAQRWGEYHIYKRRGWDKRA